VLGPGVTTARGALLGSRHLVVSGRVRFNLTPSQPVRHDVVMKLQRVGAGRTGKLTKLGTIGVALSAVVLLASSCDSRGNQYTVNSTAYCDQGQMADGNYVHDGAVAMNTYPGTNQWVPFGEHFRIETGPLAGKYLTVEDRIGYGSQFDIWIYSCGAALNYGRNYITVTDIGR